MNLKSHGHKDSLLSLNCDDQQTQRLRQAFSEFELGRYLLDNLGLNGHWTSYILMHPERERERERESLPALSSDGTPITELESWLLNRCPIFLATQERFRIFRELTQPLLHSNMKLASLPAGLMDDLLTLDYSKTSGVELTAIDLDSDTLREAEDNYRRRNPPVRFSFEQRDAWKLNYSQCWDLVTSNGLNIYVQEDDVCTEFYRNVARSLKPLGFFILSFITPHDQWRPKYTDDLERQGLLFKEVVPVRWSCMRDEHTTRKQLSSAGFKVIKIRYDSQRMFPAVVAQKE